VRSWLAQHRRAIDLALQRIAASPANSLLAALAVGIALALPGAGRMLLGNAMLLARSVSASPQLSVFMAVDAERHVTAEVEAKLRGNPGIAAVRLVSREDTLRRMKHSEGLANVIDVLPRNPFPDAFIVTPADERPEAMEALRAELQRVTRVEHVQLDSAWVRRLDALLRLGRLGLGFVAALFGVGLVAITFNTIRLQVLTRRAEIEVSRLLGATDGFVRRPFYYYGVIQGAAGGLLAWCLVLLAWWLLRAPVAELARLYTLDFALQAPGPGEGASLVGFAAALGWLGAALSVGRHLGD